MLYDKQWQVEQEEHIQHVLFHSGHTLNSLPSGGKTTVTIKLMH